MQFINTIDTILSFIDTIRRYANLKDILSILFWLLGRIVDALTSRKAIRVYTRAFRVIAFTFRMIAAVVFGFIGLCQYAIESGRIVRSGYYAVDHIETADVEIAVGDDKEIALLPDGSWAVVSSSEPEVLALPYTTIAGLLPAAPESEPRVLITPAPLPRFPQLAIADVHPVIPVFLDRRGKPLTGSAYKQRLKKVAALA